jgi:hypothetical protein
MIHPNLVVKNSHSSFNILFSLAPSQMWQLASNDFVPMGARVNQEPPQVHPMDGWIFGWMGSVVSLVAIFTSYYLPIWAPCCFALCTSDND